MTWDDAFFEDQNNNAISQFKDLDRNGDGTWIQMSLKKPEKRELPPPPW